MSVVATAAFATLTSNARATDSSGASAAKPKTIRILVTNDDGYQGEGLDVLVAALRELPRVKIDVVTPATNQTGAGTKLTPGGVAQGSAQELTTLSGYPVLAVPGSPGDSVLYALDGGVAKTPDIVISGINAGQNTGTVIATMGSGTVGAAITAARQDVPALAISQGLPPDRSQKGINYDDSVKYAVQWLKKHRKQIAAGNLEPSNLLSINVPTCPTGSVRGLLEVPIAPTSDHALDAPNCESTLEDFTDDISAFLNGYAVITSVPPGP